MISRPNLINNVSFQQSWKGAVNLLAKNGWEIRNLIVQVTDPTEFDEMFHDAFLKFCTVNSVLGPKDVAYTIFPHKLYEMWGDAVRLFDSYNRKGGLYERLRGRPRRGWGTYFHRMTHYDIRGEIQNQLKNIIDAIYVVSLIHVIITIGYKALYFIPFYSLMISATYTSQGRLKFLFIFSGLWEPTT